MFQEAQNPFPLAGGKVWMGVTFPPDLKITVRTEPVEGKSVRPTCGDFHSAQSGHTYQFLCESIETDPIDSIRLTLLIRFKTPSFLAREGQEGLILSRLVYTLVYIKFSLRG